MNKESVAGHEPPPYPFTISLETKRSKVFAPGLFHSSFFPDMSFRAIQGSRKKRMIAIFVKAMPV